MKIIKKFRLVILVFFCISFNANIIKCYSEELTKLNLKEEINKGYLLIGIKQYLGRDKNTLPKKSLLSFESKKGGMLKVISSNGLEYKSKKVDILFNRAPLSKGIVIERLVSDPFASFESAKRASLLLVEKGLEPKITYPNDWEIWLPKSAKSLVNKNFKLRKIYIRDKVVPFIKNEYVFQKIEGLTMISSNQNIKINNVEYGKNFYLIKDSYGSWTLVQKLSFNDYLRGVLPHEIGSNAPMEALKAQAIIARTWAIYNSNRFNSDNYHLCITTQCQVYKPILKNNLNIENAIKETTNMVMTFNGILMNAFYHASNGGISAPASESWEMKDYPYLITKYDFIGEQNNKFKIYFKNDKALRNFIINSNNKYFSSKHHLFRWTKKISSTQILNYISDHNSFIENDNIKDLKIIERGLSGRVIKLSIRLSGRIDPVILNKDDIRKYLKFLPSNLFIIDKLNDDFWVFRGGGFSHGVGLSQSGAIEMAKLGFKYQRILGHYYEGVKITDFKSIRYEP